MMCSSVSMISLTPRPHPKTHTRIHRYHGGILHNHSSIGVHLPGGDRRQDLIGKDPHRCKMAATGKNVDHREGDLVTSKALEAQGVMTKVGDLRSITLEIIVEMGM